MANLNLKGSTFFIHPVQYLLYLKLKYHVCHLWKNDPSLILTKTSAGKRVLIEISSSVV